jgi:peptidoglycan-associated lipoprotein
VISYGEERPLDAGHGEEAWAANRRDEFVVTRRVG